MGGSVLQRLWAHPKAQSFEISALVRNAEKAKFLETFGVKTTVGSYTDYDKLEALAAGADVVIAMVGNNRCFTGCTL